MTRISPLYAFFRSLKIINAAMPTASATKITPPVATTADVDANPVIANIVEGSAKDSAIIVPNVVVTATAVDVLTIADAVTIAFWLVSRLGAIGAAAGAGAGTGSAVFLLQGQPPFILRMVLRLAAFSINL